MYEFKKSRETIESILNSPTKIIEKDSVPSSDSEFTYENGITAWVGALFVDIVDSSSFFQVGQINNRQNDGVHHDITREQAMQCIIHTYIALGDILSLRAEVEKEQAQAT